MARRSATERPPYPREAGRPRTDRRERHLSFARPPESSSPREAWEDPQTREKLERLSNPFRSAAERSLGVRPALDLLAASGRPRAVVFAQALEEIRGPMVSRKTNRMIRAYVQNAHLLSRYHYSFRRYLLAAAGVDAVPDAGVPALERKWIAALLRDLYNVGPALAPYLICDWLLCKWRDGELSWFESYKPDSVHLGAVEEGLLPPAAKADFTEYCRTIQLTEAHLPSSHRALARRAS